METEKKKKKPLGLCLSRMPWHQWGWDVTSLSTFFNASCPTYAEACADATDSFWNVFHLTQKWYPKWTAWH